MRNKRSLDVDWAVELVGELVDEVTELMILQTTRSPENLFENANREQVFLRLYDGLKKEVASVDSSPDDILETISCVLVTIGIELKSALRDSISCDLYGGNFIEVPPIFLKGI